MELNEEKILIKILSSSELEKIPTEIAKKLDSYFVEKFEEYITSKALCETTKSDIEKLREGLEKKIAELTSKNEDYEAKLLQSQQSTQELRQELDISRKEAKSLHESVYKYENETSEYRRERNEAVDERDSLLKMIERRNIEVERLQLDISNLETQLNAAINTKCEALAKLDEIQSKEVSLEFKEKRMDQEKILLNNTIKTLNDDLNRNMAELGSIRREHTLRVLSLETKLNEKTEELKITNSINAQLSETNTSLTLKAEELNTKLLKHSEEVTKMMDNYKKELIAKTKLAELYKDTSEDGKNQINELNSGICELKKLLNEATDQYGELETKFKQAESNHAEELDEKDKKLEALHDELRHANELLKVSREENLEHAIESIAPTAAASSRLIKSGMSLTEIYSIYVKTSEELQLKKKENARLLIQINSILQEVTENAPKFQKQAIEHQNLYESNTEMKQQIENMIAERVEQREELNDAMSKVNYFERENKKLKTELADVARQVCFLLKEIEQIRGGFVSEAAQSVTSDMSAEEVITKQLVTFSNIEELQQRNQNLLKIVRDLSSKLEEMDQGQANMQQEHFASKIETYTKRIKELQNAQESQTQMFSACMQQKERFKKLYYDSLKNSNKTGHFDGVSLNGGDDIQMEEDIPLASSSSISSSQDHTRDKQKITELEEKVKELAAQLKSIKEEYENYRKEKLTNEKMVNEQFDSMRSEMRELTSTNCRLASQSEFSTEQLKIIQKNVAAYKKQISALEERNKSYENSIIKHEQTIMHIKDEALSAQSKASRYEVTIDHLKHEVQILRDNESRLQVEREVLNRERQSQNLLLNNLEMIKASFERSETEGRMRMESRLDELTRECSALRRRLQEEQDRFRELTGHLERQTETAKQKMEDEIIQANKLRNELGQIRQENVEKSKQIEDLSKKLQESLTPSLHDNPIAQANKRAREMEMKYEQTKSDLAMLEKELETTKEHVKQYCTLANSSENELKELHDKYSTEKGQLEHELIRLRKIELEYKARIEELETEISLQITGAQLNSGDTSTQLHKTQLELQEVLKKLNDNNRELRELRTENHNLSSSLQVAEHKYANEMIQHSTDIQAMTKLKDELNRVMEQVSGIKSERDKAVETLNMTSQGWEEKDRLISAEREQLEHRIEDLNSQNAALHDQIQVLSSKLSVTAAVSVSSMPSNDTPDNGGSGDVEMSDSFMNKTLNEEEIKSSEQLLQIVKYLRKEKDIAVAKVDILRTETARLQSEQSVLQSKLDEAINAVEQERTKTDVGVVTAAKHAELLRKIETLNAITDSNRTLREERDTLSKKFAELTERITKAEDELFPLQEKNRELLTKADAAAAENASLRIEATRWRQRANLLVERSNKTSPEDFKRLQSERENLAKMLTAEKELLKKTSDELATIKMEKARLDTELQNLAKQLGSSQEESKKYQDDLNTLKQVNARMTHEIIELKNNVLLKEEELKKVTEDLNNKEAQLADAKNKEVQIRKIAKRYKDSYFDLKNKDPIKDGEKTDEALSNPGGESSASAANQSDMDKVQDKVNELNAQILSAKEESEALRKENESLKGIIEKEEKNKNLLKEAKTRILTLTETKNNVTRELAATKLQLQNIEQNREESDLLISGLKTQFETRINRLETQHSDQDKEKQETIVRLTRENENLLLIINQLNRQLQGSKPSTSSNPIEKATTDNPRTANVKPMAGPSGQQSATVTPWRGEPPLASIRPIQNSRTAAVLPTSQTSNIASVQGSSSTGSVTALVPPQQQVHTTGNNNSGEALSSSPTSSHTDYMPATSSAAVVVAAVPPMGSGAANAESSQEAESIPTINNDSSSNQIIITGGQQQQAVALVSPRVEGAQQNVVPPQSTAPVSNQEVNQAPSTSGTSSTTPAAISSHHQASSSNTVTTTQAAHKRPRDIEGDSSTGNNDESDKQTQVKRPRAQGSETFQGVSESGIEVEYQVPTSSQRDQEDDIIVVDSEDDDDGMADEGNAEADDGPFEDDADNGDGYEMEESYEQEQEMANYDEGEGPDIDEDNVQSDNNEVEVDDSSEVPNQSGSSNHVAPDGGSTNVVVSHIGSSDVPVASTQNSSETQQIQTISSGSDAPGSSTARQNSPHIRQAIASHLILLQQRNKDEVYEESGDDSIVPSTPTLYTPRRSDGFSEAVSSPHSQVPHAARFTFSEPRAIPGPSSLVPNDGMDDTRVDLSELDDSRSVSNTPQKVESGSNEHEQSSSNGTQQEEVVAGSSRDTASVPEIMVTGASGEDDMDEDATTSDAPDDDRDADKNESGDIDEGEGADGVSSEGEKAPGAEGIIVEEGREAEATQTPSSNTRSRSTRGSGGTSNRRGGRYNNRANRAPITWGDAQRGGASGRNLQINVRNIDSGSPSRQIFQGQRSQRARRMKHHRPFGNNNMRY